MINHITLDWMAYRLNRYFSPKTYGVPRRGSSSGSGRLQKLWKMGVNDLSNTSFWPTNLHIRLYLVWFRSLVQWSENSHRIKRKGWVSVTEHNGNWDLFWDVFGLGWILFQFTCSIHLSKLPRFSPSPGRQGHRTRPSILLMQSNQKKRYLPLHLDG